jgi:diphthine synthase
MPVMGKGSLSLVGMGISDERGISLEGLDELKACEKVFAENYTSIMPRGSMKRLSEIIGKEIKILPREILEGEKKILDFAKVRKTSLVCAGDPMVATTHISLILSAKKMGIPTSVIHSSSILPAAAGECGLQAYKFGKTVTLAYWREGYRPMAAYDVVAENLSRGQHTLLLLDIDEKLGPMKPSAAKEIMLGMEKKGKKGIFKKERKIALLKGIGWRGGGKAYCKIADLPGYDRLEGPATIIIPGSLHFVEREALESL